MPEHLSAHSNCSRTECRGILENEDAPKREFHGPSIHLDNAMSYVLFAYPGL